MAGKKRSGLAYHRRAYTYSTYSPIEQSTADPSPTAPSAPTALSSVG